MTNKPPTSASAHIAKLADQQRVRVFKEVTGRKPTADELLLIWIAQDSGVKLEEAIDAVVAGNEAAMARFVLD